MPQSSFKQRYCDRSIISAFAVPGVLSITPPESHCYLQVQNYVVLRVTLQIRLRDFGFTIRISKYAAWYFQVYALVRRFRRKFSMRFVNRQWGNTFDEGESGTVVPLLTGAASTPWCPSHAGVSMLHTKSFPRR